ncbi:PDR/VanB family oxidoreductase [Azospirillum sp. ST 5-10]|uniref:PDR/VanB family oxidoreductase n=1 Tax=unclassified Azospirillum TaxID=2630922 RepID=UPI003F49FC96
MTPADTHRVLVRTVRCEADRILSFELVDPDGRPLPPFEAGAHVDVELGDGIVRQYSLAQDPAERGHYRIAVLREAGSRGGSQALHERVRPGDVLRVSTPRNLFRLIDGARFHLLLAGGIGVTPLLAMAYELDRRGADFVLHYCTRSPAGTAFAGELASRLGDRVLLHHDGGDPARGLDLASLLRKPPAGAHVYYCGPGGFMGAVRMACAHWPGGTVHCEYFSAPADTPAAPAEDIAFTVRIARTGQCFTVPPDRSIVQVLRANGVAVDTMCEDGYCGTCLTRYVAGEPDHRDSVLDEEDRRQYLLICRSRARSGELVIDV